MTGDAPLCKDLDASGIRAALSVKTVQLPAPTVSSCGKTAPCRHAFYAAMPRGDGEHALLYNDANGKATVVLFDAED